MNKIKNLLLYAGLSKEEFYNIKNRRNSQNRISLIIFSIIGFVGFFLLLLSAVFNIGAFRNNDIIYIVCTVLFLSLFFIILKFGKKIWISYKCPDIFFYGSFAGIWHFSCG